MFKLTNIYGITKYFDALNLKKWDFLEYGSWPPPSPPPNFFWLFKINVQILEFWNIFINLGIKNTETKTVVIDIILIRPLTFEYFISYFVRILKVKFKIRNFLSVWKGEKLMCIVIKTDQFVYSFIYETKGDCLFISDNYVN